MGSYLHFIRHGITEGILNRWYYGWLDLPLTTEGWTELKRLKDCGIYPSFENAVYYTSGLLRTEETLEAIYGGVPHEALPLMKEMNFGLWEGKSFEDLKSEEGFDEWMSTTDGSFTFPEGESSVTFSLRVKQGLSELLANHRERETSQMNPGGDTITILCCHGGVIAAAMQQLFPGFKDNFWQWIPEPGRGYTVHLEGGHPLSYVPI